VSAARFRIIGINNVEKLRALLAVAKKKPTAISPSVSLGSA